MRPGEKDGQCPRSAAPERRRRHGTGKARAGAQGSRWSVGLCTRGFASNNTGQTGARATRTPARGPDLRSTGRSPRLSPSRGGSSAGPGLASAFTRLCPQGLPQRPQGTPAPGQPAGPAQPSDHSYALLDLDALKTKLFLTLKENEKLRKRLKAQRLVMRRMCGRLRAHRAGQPGPQSRAGRPGFPVSAPGARAVAPEATVRQARPTTSHLRGGVAASARDRNGTVGRTDSVLPEGTGANCPSNGSWAGVFSTTA